MRELKFKAWDKEKNEWYEPIHEAYKGKLWELMIGFSGDLLAHTTNGISHESIFKDRYVLTQYTGFKDKNDKEIYEGDILQDDWRSLRYEVRFEKGSFIITGEGRVSSFRDNSDIFQNRMTVIGDIYNNPELIK